MTRIRLRSSGIALLALLLALGLGLTGCGGKDDAENKSSGKQVADKEQQGEEASGDWVAVTLIDGSVFFGQAAEASTDDAMLIDDAYFISDDGDDDVNRIRRFGSEIHKPRPAVIIPRSSVRYEQSLASTSPVLSAIRSFEKKTPIKTRTSEMLEDGTITAVFVNSSEVYFGRAFFDGEQLVLRDAHYLAYKNQRAATREEVESLDDLALVPQASAPIAPDGVMRFPIRSVLYMQTLESESPVVKALK